MNVANTKRCNYCLHTGMQDQQQLTKFFDDITKYIYNNLQTGIYIRSLLCSMLH